MNNMLSATLAIVGGVISLAIISVLVSRQAQTPQVLESAGGALGTVISAAVSPVTGHGGSSAPTGSFGGSGSGFDTSDAISLIATAGKFFV
jgi:hypothetical protein